MWVKRAQNLNDNWKLRLFRGSYNNIYNLRAKNFNKNEEPILYNIAKSFDVFTKCHCVVNENFLESYIFENETIPFEQGIRGCLDQNFVSDVTMRLYGNKIRNLKVKDLLEGRGTARSYERFSAATSIIIPEQKFLVLMRACTGAWTRLAKTDVREQKSDGVMEIFNRVKQLSQFIRRTIQGDLRFEIPNNVKKFSDNTDTIVNLNDSRVINSLWGINAFDNSTKTFLFKLHNNTLGYNYTVTKHVNTVSKDCTFCILTRINEETTETPLHIFFTCPNVEPLIKGLYNWLHNTVGVEHVSRQDFFIVPNTENSNDVKLLLVVYVLIKKYIWDCKLRFTVPVLEDMKAVIISELKRMLRLDSKLLKKFEKCTFHRNLAHHIF